MFFRKNFPAFIWTLVIFALCSMPGKAIPHISWLELLSFDKFVHASIFFVLQVLYMRGFSQQNHYLFLQKNYGLLAFLICVAYGGILELMQAFFFSERSGDLLDFIANSFGCVCGLLLFGSLRRKIKFFSGAAA
ncbi:MAG: VanZ family protein [Bacteroidia bacterium]